MANETHQSPLRGEVKSSADYMKKLKGLDTKQLRQLLIKYQTKDPTVSKSKKYEKWERGAKDNQLVQSGIKTAATIGGGALGSYLAPGAGTAIGAGLGGGVGDLLSLLTPHEMQRGDMAEVEQGRIDETMDNQQENMMIVEAIQGLLNEKDATSKALLRLAQGTGQRPTITSA